MADPGRTVVVVTSIAAPNRALRTLAEGCGAHGHPFLVVGDARSPADFSLPGCRYYGLAEQRRLDLRFPARCPTNHYARKNIGYLLAMAGGAEVIVETDDDNVPLPSFWLPRSQEQSAAVVSGSPAGTWVNAYALFSDELVWPRGFPLDHVRSAGPDFDALSQARMDCPVQQGLADGDPDVDAIHRLVLPLPGPFRRDRRVAMTDGAWCPFNSQNTTWFRDAFPLLYLPSHCSFRMTDIWRSFVAQRIGWANGWSVLFHEATVRQDRNEHDLRRDLADEVPGYLHNATIGEALLALDLAPGAERLADNLRLCWAELVRMALVDPAELDLLDDWLADVGAILGPSG